MCIMAVDADREMLKLFESNLHTVFPEEEIAVFSNPMEALKCANRKQIDILFTDVRLKPLDGYELIKTIRRLQKTPCSAYVVSGSRDKPDDLKWMAVNGSYTKPMTIEELTEIRKKLEDCL